MGRVSALPSVPRPGPVLACADSYVCVGRTERDRKRGKKDRRRGDDSH